MALNAGLVSCGSYVERTSEFRKDYRAADFVAADERIDELIASASGTDLEEVRQSHGLSESIDVTQRDTPLLLLEKATVRLALRDPDSAIELLRKARDELDRRMTRNVAGYVAATLSDDTAIPYPGADYEHILVRVMLFLADTLAGGRDMQAYAFQIGEKQEEILGSSFGAEEGYNPRQQYKRLGIGAYIEGVVREGNRQPLDAAKAFGRAIQYEGKTELLKTSFVRAYKGRYSQPGNGVLHVFYLGGEGPHLTETTSPPTDLASKLAGVAIAVAGKSASALAQTAIPVPEVIRGDDVSEVPFQVNGQTYQTHTLLDLSDVAEKQLQANMPWIMARAMARRAVKAAAAASVETGLRQSGNRYAQAFGLLAGLATNLAWTAAESADTRSWTSLPAEIQVARIELPSGTHDISLPGGTTGTVNILPGTDSFVVVLQPNLGRDGIVLVDSRSQSAGEFAVRP